MENSQLPITVLMPVYNEPEKFLRPSIESILNQTFLDFEFLIINDGSTDKACIAVLDEYAKKDNRIKIVNNRQNIGLTKTLNKGLGIAAGKYMARMDSDDISLPKRLEMQFNFMENNPDVELIGSWAYFIDENDNIIGEKRSHPQYKKIKSSIIKYNFFTHPTWFFRKSLIEKVGNYSEKSIKTEDYDFLLRIAQKHRIANLPEFLLKYRINMKGVSFSRNKLQEKYSISARLRAIRNYDYAKSNYIYLVMPILMYLFVPFFLKKRLMMSIIKRSEG